MIVKQYIKDFEKLGLGLFVHFGIYSVLGSGEWIMERRRIEKDAYRALTKDFCPRADWAEKLVSTAKAAGCKYITLTARHHDGFSLYDTCGLNDYDAPHSAAGRDLVREFVDACNKEGIIPFFYHTLLDWSTPSYNDNFPEYLSYLRQSVELLCKNYGRIGGIWFDGMWNKPDVDWEEDALYGMIRSYQPNAMIINNTGLDARGSLGHPELDSVTFERGKPMPINLKGSPKYIASEMCQVFAEHWGYAAFDFSYKSMPEIIEDLCACRACGANYLLNVGPMSDGYIRTLDAAMLLTLGEWVEINKEALYLPTPSKIDVCSPSGDFILQYEDKLYLFCYGLTITGDPNVVPRTKDGKKHIDSFMTDRRIKSIKWTDGQNEISFSQDKNKVTVIPTDFPYGANTVVRIAIIETEKI